MQGYRHSQLDCTLARTPSTRNKTALPRNVFIVCTNDLWQEMGGREGGRGRKEGGWGKGRRKKEGQMQQSSGLGCTREHGRIEQIMQRKNTCNIDDGRNEGRGQRAARHSSSTTHSNTLTIPRILCDCLIRLRVKRHWPSLRCVQLVVCCIVPNLLRPWLNNPHPSVWVALQKTNGEEKN